MKLFRVLAATVLVTPFAAGQPPAIPAPACSKNVSFSVAQDGQPVPAVPKFAAKWISDKKHQTNYSDLCFSQIPDPKAANYVIVFSTSASSLEGLIPTAHTYTRAAPSSLSEGVTGSYGGTWDYSYLGPMTKQATATASLQYADKSKALFVRVYNQQGGLVAQNSLDKAHSRENLLESVIANIRAYSYVSPKQRPFVAPLSIYYVNCDVDGPPTQKAAPPSSEMARSEPAPKAAAQDTSLEFWSSPMGADIFLDGAYVGKTPYSLTVPPGEHTIAMRKKDFRTWQRKMQLSAGNRRVAAYLEQKAITIGFGSP